MKISSLFVHQLKKESLLFFLRQVVATAENCPAIRSNLNQWLQSLSADLAEAVRINNITLRSPFTAELQMSDRQRDGIITGLRHIVRAFEKSVIAEEREAARLLMIGLTSLKLNISDQYVEQTGEIANLLQFLLEKERASLEVLNLVSVAEQLQVVNERVRGYIQDNVDKLIRRETGAFQRARSAVELSYRQFILSVNSFALLHPELLGNSLAKEGSIHSAAPSSDQPDPASEKLSSQAIGISGEASAAPSSDQPDPASEKRGSQAVELSGELLAAPSPLGEGPISLGEFISWMNAFIEFMEQKLLRRTKDEDSDDLLIP